MKTIKINRESLEKSLEEAFKKALDFNWTGWRIPVYVDEEGNCSLGGWLSNNSWRPDAEELPIKVETWNMSDLGYDDFDDDDIDYEIEGKIEWYTAQLEVYYHEEIEYKLI